MRNMHLVALTALALVVTVGCDRKYTGMATPNASGVVDRADEVDPRASGDWALVGDQTGKAILAGARTLTPVDTNLLLIYMSGFTIQEAINKDAFSGHLSQVVGRTNNEFERHDRLEKLQAQITQFVPPLMNTTVAVRLMRMNVGGYDFENKRLILTNTGMGNFGHFGIGTIAVNFTNLPELRDGLPMQAENAKALTTKMSDNRVFYPWVVFTPSQMKRVAPSDAGDGVVEFQGPAALLILVDEWGRVFYSFKA